MANEAAKRTESTLAPRAGGTDAEISMGPGEDQAIFHILNRYGDVYVSCPPLSQMGFTRGHSRPWRQTGGLNYIRGRTRNTKAW
jgi:hypothetical protein